MEELKATSNMEELHQKTDHPRDHGESVYKVNALRCSLNGAEDIDVVWPKWWDNESIAWRMRHLAVWMQFMSAEMTRCLNAEYHHKMQAIQNEQKSNRVMGGEPT